MNIPIKYHLPPGSLWYCKSPPGRLILALVLSHDDEYSSIVHTTLFVRGETFGEAYRINLVPIEYFTLLDSITGKLNLESLTIKHEEYAEAHEQWLDSHNDGIKTFFVIPPLEIIKIYERLRSPPPWGLCDKWFYPCTNSYKVDKQVVVFNPQILGKTLPGAK